MMYKRILAQHREDVAHMIIELDKQLAYESDAEAIEQILTLKEQLKTQLAILEDSTSTAFKVDVVNSNKLETQLGW